MKKPVFEGVATALVTPFKQGTVDFAVMNQLLDLQLAAGVDAVVVCGTTGEASTTQSNTAPDDAKSSPEPVQTTRLTPCS